MPSLSFLFCQCAVILISFGEIVCDSELFDFVIESFSCADIYSKVEFHGPVDKPHGHLVLKKRQLSRSKLATEFHRQLVISLSDILHYTIKQEGNNPKIVSFSVRRQYYSNYNIKFTTDGQARHFVRYKSLPAIHEISWARVYSHWRPVIMAYDRLNNGDIGFKYIDNGNYPDLDERLEKLNYVFRRSEIHNAVRTTPSHSLYLKNVTRLKEYEIKFKSANHLQTFLELFPKKIFDEARTMNYYFMQSLYP